MTFAFFSCQNLSEARTLKAFGLKNDVGTYDVLVNADITEFNNKVLIKNGKIKATVNNAKFLNQFFECILNPASKGDTSCVVGETKYFDKTRSRYHYLKYADELHLVYSLNWAGHMSFLIQYKTTESTRFRFDVINFDCNKNCTIINNFDVNQLDGSSTGLYDLVTSIFDIYKAGEIVNLENSSVLQKYSSFTLFGKSSNVKVYVNFRTPPLNNGRSKRFVKQLNDCYKLNCENSHMNSIFKETLGNNFDEYIYSLILSSDVKAVSYAGFVSSEDFISRISRNQSCSSYVSYFVGADEQRVFKCVDKNLNDSFFILAYHNERIDLDRLNYPSLILLSSLSAAHLIVAMTPKSPKVTHISGINEIPNISILSIPIQKN